MYAHISMSVLLVSLGGDTATYSSAWMGLFMFLPFILLRNSNQNFAMTYEISPMSFTSNKRLLHSSQYLTEMSVASFSQAIPTTLLINTREHPAEGTEGTGDGGGVL